MKNRETVRERLLGWAFLLYDKEFDVVFLWGFYNVNSLDNAVEEAKASGLVCFDDLTVVEVDFQ